MKTRLDFRVHSDSIVENKLASKNIVNETCNLLISTSKGLHLHVVIWKTGVIYMYIQLPIWCVYIY